MQGNTTPQSMQPMGQFDFGYAMGDSPHKYPDEMDKQPHSIKKSRMEWREVVTQ